MERRIATKGIEIFMDGPLVIGKFIVMKQTVLTVFIMHRVNLNFPVVDELLQAGAQPNGVDYLKNTVSCACLYVPPMLRACNHSCIRLAALGSPPNIPC